MILVDLTELEESIQIVVKNTFQECIENGRFGPEFVDETWDRKTTATFLKMSQEKVTELVKKNEIPGRKIGRDYVFLKSQIISMLKRRN